MGNLKVDREELKEYSETHTIQEIAEKFGISYHYTALLLRKLGLKPKVTKYRQRKLSDEQIEELKEYAKNHTCKECEYNFQISQGLLAKYEKVFGFTCLRKCSKGIPRALDSKSCKRCGEAHDMIVTLSSTYTDASIARVFGYSRERVRQILLERKGKEK